MANRLIIYFYLAVLGASAQDMTRVEYIAKHKDLAIAEMQQYGIPASITMAQGILESGDGNSELARKAKNHFGIKCHTTWMGKTVYHDDDEAKECFRKYPTVGASYKDHSIFLQKARYAALFELSITDYKGWAKGLKKADYATNPKYPNLLIKIIEDHQLYVLDKVSDAPFMAKRFYHGIIYGWPSIIGQQAIYKNEHKGFLLTGNVAGSLDHLHLLLGRGKLLHHKIGVGANVGIALDEPEDQILLTLEYGVSVQILLPYKEKVWFIHPSVMTSDMEQFTPAISVGLLR